MMQMLINGSMHHCSLSRYSNIMEVLFRSPVTNKSTNLIPCYHVFDTVVSMQALLYITT